MTINDSNHTDTNSTDNQDGEFVPQTREMRYRDIVEDQTELVCRYDTDFKLTFGNSAYCKSFGVPPEEIIGQSLLIKIPPEEREAGIAHIRSLNRDNPVAVSIHHSIQADGSVRWFEWKDRAILNDDGQIIEYQGVGRDITEQKRAEEALLESQERMRLFIEHAPAAIAMLDKEMRYIAISRRWRSDYRLNDRNIIGLSHYEVFPDIPDQWREIHQRCLSGAVEMSAADPFPRIDGTVDWVRWEIHPWRQSDGEIGGILLFSEVITERIQAKAALEEAYNVLEQRVVERTLELERAKDRLEAIFDHSGDGILLLDVQNGIQQANHAFSEMLGVPIDRCVGTHLDAWLHPADSIQLNQILQSVAWTHQTQGVEAKVVRADRTLVDVEINIAPVNRTRYTVRNLVCIIRDITERKRAEEALQQMLVQEKELGELKSRFVSMASHEFRTPLAAILAATETLSLYRDRMSETQITERLDRIRQQVSFMKDIMEDVLQLARIQAGRVDYKPSLGDVGALCQEIIEEFESQTDYHGRIRYSCIMPPVEMLFDRRLLRQVIVNLLQNALKYSEVDKFVWVKLSQDDAQITLRVQDEGIGIPPDDLKRLFEPFHRATNVGVISGTGLGLSITKQAVEIHGGTISADSQIGKGTIFTVRIPKMPLV